MIELLCLFLHKIEKMQWTQRNRSIKYILIFIAICIATFFLVFSHFLVKDLKDEASAKMSVWAEAMRTLNNATDDTDLNLVLYVIDKNYSIPIIVLDNHGEIEQYRNITFQPKSSQDSIAYLQNRVRQMKEKGYSIKIAYNEEENNGKEYLEILYDDSSILKRLEYYPYIQLAILLIFTIIIIVTLLSLKRAEQNRVWVGLTKETAHQLGTPISSLIAWNEILKETYPDNQVISEMDKDVKRLQLIADRFSKVGSAPELVDTDLKDVIWHVVNYISKRFAKVNITCSLPATDVHCMLCAPLFEWVIENLCKNAIDAMEGSGSITITMHELTEKISIDVADSGKGIPKNKFNTVFAPGYTTKSRGWGLGLSLTKRIIEDYHHGSIYVKSSEPNKGTVFRIDLKTKV